MSTPCGSRTGTRPGAPCSGGRWSRPTRRIDHPQAGLYLWASRPGHDGWGSVAALAGAGILVAPGEFYGAAGTDHVRVALTATDERVRSAADRRAYLAAR